MAKPIGRQISREISEEQWSPFFADFTMENRGAHARLEIIGLEELGYEVETEDRPFDGVSADNKDGERTVWLSFGGGAEKHLAHGVHKATVVRSLSPEGSRGAVLEIEAQDGSKTILTLSKPEEFMLPPGESRERRT